MIMEIGKSLQEPSRQMPPAAANTLRVAIVSDWCLPRRGGIEIHILALAAELRRAGIQASIVTSFPGPDTVNGVPIDRVPSLLLPAASIAISPGLVGMITERLAGRYDLVHLHASQVAPFCLAAAIAARNLDLPVVATFHSFMGILPLLMAMADRQSGWSHGNTAITAVSSRVAGQIKRRMPWLDVSLLPNGFQREVWCRPKTKSWGTGDAPLHLVSAMRLERRKRPGALLDVFAAAMHATRRSPPGMHLTIAGDGREKRALERRVRREGLEEHVRFAGWLAPDALSELYANADLFVMPSRKEAFCIAALEARAAGLPVIGMAGTGLTDFIEDGISGELASNDADMAARLLSLYRDRQRLAGLASASGQLERYDWTNLAREHIAFYQARCRRGEGSRQSLT